jgi:hypothetical protein
MSELLALEPVPAPPPVAGRPAVAASSPAAVRPAVRRLASAVPVLVLVAIGIANLQPIEDPDFWWLLRGGRYVVETRTFPTADPFSATAAGAEWLNHAWGFELLLYGVHAVAGLAGVVWLQGLLALATFAVLYGTLRREGLGVGPALGIVVVGALATRGFWSPRPQLATYLLLAVFAAVLAGAARGRTRGLRWLPPLAVVWVNVHGGFLIGPALIVLAAAGELAGWFWDGDRAALRRTGMLAGTALATLAASLLNPFHYRALLFPLAVMSDRVGKEAIIEWASPAFSAPQVMLLEAMFLAVLLVSLRTERRVAWRELVVLAPLVHLALQSTRNTPIFVIAATPVLGRVLADWRPGWRPRTVAGRLAAGAGLAVAVAVACALSVGSWSPGQVGRALAPGFGTAGPFPAEAVRFLDRSGGSGTLLNEYGWGGYLIWHLYPAYRVSIDGRMAVYGPARFLQHVTVTELRPGWREVVARLDPTLALLDTASPLARALRADGWTVLHEDSVATVLRPPEKRG